MDTKDILAVIEKFNATALAEFKYKEGSVEFHLKRHADVTYAAPVMTHAPAAHAGPAHAPVAAPAGTPASAASAAPAASAGTNFETINSPIVGTFYRAAAPDAAPYVEEGKVVKKGETLCIIEAMKVMNELQAEFDCEIVRIVADTNQFVEYGTPLFEVRKK